MDMLSDMSESERLEDTFADRVRRRRKASGLTQAQLAKKAGMSQQAITGIETGRNQSNTDNLFSLAKALNCSPFWLHFGRGPESMGLLDAEPPIPVDDGNWTQIPVVSLVQAGSWNHAVDSFEPGDGYDFLEVDKRLASTLSVGAFALEIVGDSMLPEFREGDRVIVDPGWTPKPGDIVVAKLDDQDEATIKKYREGPADEEGYPVIELVPLNTDYATLRMDQRRPGRVVGVVVEHRRVLRRL